MRLLFLLLLPVFGSSQVYIKLEAQFAKTEQYSLTGGGGLSFGGMTKSGVYFGIGALMIHDENPYVPVFFETGYSPNNKVIFPNVNFRLGHSISDNQPFDGTYSKAGFFIDGRIGVAYRPGMKVVRIIPYAGYSNISVTGGSVGYFNYGLSLLLIRPK